MTSDIQDGHASSSFRVSKQVPPTCPQRSKANDGRLLGRDTVKSGRNYRLLEEAAALKVTVQDSKSHCTL